MYLLRQITDTCVTFFAARCVLKPYYHSTSQYPDHITYRLSLQHNIQIRGLGQGVETDAPVLSSEIYTP